MMAYDEDKEDRTDNMNAAVGASELSGLVMPAVGEIVAIRYLDNSTGDRDIFHCLAYVTDDGKWICEGSLQPLLEYEDDEILEWWALNPGTGNKVA